MTGLSVTSQQDFSQGQFGTPTPERIPAAGVYQAINGLLDVEQGVVYRRGGSAFKSNADIAGGPPLHIWSGYLRPGLRTLFTRGSAYALNPSDDATPVQVSAGGVAQKSSVAVVDGVLFMGCYGSVFEEVWGGATKAAYSTGTATATNGSATITGVGTSWSANVEAGSIFTNANGFAIVKSVDSNTQLTLTQAWPAGTLAGAYQTVPYLVASVSMTTINPNLEANNPLVMAAVGSPARRLAAMGSVVAFTARGNPFSWTASDYHRLPQGAVVSGLQALDSDALVFTSQGLFAIRNMAYDLTDAYGNPQQSLATLSKSFNLWGNLGIAAWEGSLICPAVDDIFLVNASGVQQPISAAIRTSYRQYTETAGYIPGQAAVHRGHYFLPVVSGVPAVANTVFVCNLQTGGWTEWSGLSAAVSYVERGGNTPLLLGGASSGRLLNVNGCFNPSSSNKAEPDASVHPFSVTMRDYATGANKSNMVKKARLRFEGTAAAGSPTLGLSVASGPVSASFTGCSTTDGSTVGPSSGTQEVPYAVNKAARYVRFKVSTTDAWDSLKIKGLELFVRPRGRQ